METKSATELKDLGNSYIKSGNVLKATETYSDALKLPNEDKMLTFFLYSNRSYSNFLLGNYCDAFFDACKAIETDSTQFKGYLRRSNVLEKLNFLEDSIKDIETAIKLSKNPKETENLTSRLNYLQKLKTTTDNPDIEFNDPPYSLKVKEDLDLPGAKLLGEFIFDNKRLSNYDTFLTKLIDIFKEDVQNSPNNILRITAPKCTVLGNIYGDLGKLYEFFDKNGYPSKENVYIINGNFIGQADHRLIIILFLFKYSEPRSIYFTKGHFDLSSSNFTIKAKKFLEHEYKAEGRQIIFNIIDHFPIFVIVNDKYCVMNGGFLKEKNSLCGQFSKIIEKDVEFCDNYPIFCFGEKYVMNFLSENKCDVLVCSNLCVSDGFETLMNGKLINVSFTNPNPNFKENKNGYVVITDSNVEPLVFNFDLFPLEVHYDESKCYFQGVFYTLRKYTNQSPAMNGIVKVYAISEDFVPVSSTIDTSIYSFDYMSVPTPGSWIMVDFKDRKIKVENYSIESARLNKNNDHMKSWKLEGSNDGNYWIVIDVQNNVEELNGPMCNQVFGIKDNAREFFRFIRILQHKKNHRGNWNLCLGHFDLFGTIK